MIALGHGGATESVVGGGADATGVFFDAPTPHEIASAIESFLVRPKAFSPEVCRRRAAEFSADRFRACFTAIVDEELERAGDDIRGSAAPLKKPILALSE